MYLCLYLCIFISILIFVYGNKPRINGFIVDSHELDSSGIRELVLFIVTNILWNLKIVKILGYRAIDRRTAINLAIGGHWLRRRYLQAYILLYGSSHEHR